MTSSTDSVSEGKESGDCGEYGGDAGILDRSNGGIVPLKSPGGWVRKSFGMFKAFGEFR